MKRNAIVTLAVLAGLATGTRAQYYRPPGLEPGESRHMLEEVQRQERRAEEARLRAWTRAQEPYIDPSQFRQPAPEPWAPPAAPAPAEEVAGVKSSESNRAEAAASPPGGRPFALWWAVALGAAVLTGLAVTWRVRRTRLQPGRTSG